MVSFGLGKKKKDVFFLSCHECGIKKKFCLFYWAVPPGSNPAGTVTVTHASALSPQMQTQIQSQVCKIMIVVGE